MQPDAQLTYYISPWTSIGLAGRREILSTLGVRFVTRTESPSLNNFSSIPHKVSKAPGHLVRYIDEHRFHVITFINTLHNFDVLKSMEYSGKVLFEFHGKTEGIVNSLRFINELKDGGMIQGIVVPSRYAAEIAYENLRNRPDLSVFVARNTLDTTLFSARPVGDFLDKYHIPIRWMTNPIIGWVGRIEPNKNWRALVRVFRRVRRKYPRVKLLLCSDVTVSPDVDLFNKTMVKNHFKWGKDYLILSNMPHQEMPFFYNVIAKSGGAMISTSLREGYPYHVLESQACYCPVICSAIRGSKEIVQDNETGLVFSLKQESLADKCVQRLLVDQSLRHRLVENARNSVCMTNQIETNIVDYIDWMKSVKSISLCKKGSVS
jgi:glycosyltransferase involved in cell wall biosynthesis